jgi:hypothetical protein
MLDRYFPTLPEVPLDQDNVRRCTEASLAAMRLPTQPDEQTRHEVIRNAAIARFYNGYQSEAEELIHHRYGAWGRHDLQLEAYADLAQAGDRDASLYAMNTAVIISAERGGGQEQLNLTVDEATLLIRAGHDTLTSAAITLAHQQTDPERRTRALADLYESGASQALAALLDSGPSLAVRNQLAEIALEQEHLDDVVDLVIASSTNWLSKMWWRTRIAYSNPRFQPGERIDATRDLQDPGSDNLRRLKENPGMAAQMHAWLFRTGETEHLKLALRFARKARRHSSPEAVDALGCLYEGGYPRGLSLAEKRLRRLPDEQSRAQAATDLVVNHVPSRPDIAMRAIQPLRDTEPVEAIANLRRLFRVEPTAFSIALSTINQSNFPSHQQAAALSGVARAAAKELYQRDRTA